MNKLKTFLIALKKPMIYVFLETDNNVAKIKRNLEYIIYLYIRRTYNKMNSLIF